MTSTPPPVWPGAEAAAPMAGQPPVRIVYRSSAAALVAVALAGALVGFTGSHFIDRSPTLSDVSAALHAAGTTSTSQAAPAAATNPAPAPVANAAPAANANPAPAANRAPAASAKPTPAANGGRANDSAHAAIQQAIQALDDAQVKAVSSKDLSGLGAGATTDFAAQQHTDTQDLLDNGVTDIKLVNIEWGAITVNGNSATATAFETWTTSQSDGTTEQSRDRNEYALVQQDGTWVVQTDEHPDAQAGGAPGGLDGLPGVPNNLLPPGFVSPFRNPGGQGAPQPGQGNTAPSVPVQP